MLLMICKLQVLGKSEAVYIIIHTNWSVLTPHTTHGVPSDAEASILSSWPFWTGQGTQKHSLYRTEREIQRDTGRGGFCERQTKAVVTTAAHVGLKKTPHELTTNHTIIQVITSLLSSHRFGRWFIQL